MLEVFRVGKTTLWDAQRSLSRRTVLYWALKATQVSLARKERLLRRKETILLRDKPY